MISIIKNIFNGLDCFCCSPNCPTGPLCVVFFTMGLRELMWFCYTHLKLKAPTPFFA